MEPNVKLILKDEAEEQCEILVWSQVMINASPYFRTMLDPAKFEEGRNLQKNGILSLELQETNAEAMAILCDMWHLKFGRVPTADISSDTLYEIALLVDKYDCAESIQPWPRLWVEQRHIQVEIAGKGKMDMNDIGKWICICCYLDYNHEFQSLTSELIQRATREEFLEEASEYFLNLFPSLKEAVKRRRHECLQQFRQFCMDFVSDLEKGESCHLEAHGGSENEKFNCSSIQLGNAILALKAHLGSDWQCEQDWTGSINDLYIALQCVGRKLQGPSRLADDRGDYYSRKSRDHRSCTQSNQFGEKLKAIYEPAIASLPFREFGNMAYRTPRSDADTTE